MPRGGCVVAAGGGAFDDEAVYPAIGAAKHGCCQGVGRDDSQELWPRECRQRAFRIVRRIEAHHGVLVLPVLALRQSRNGELVLGRPLFGVCVQNARDVKRDARAHQYISHARQHCAVDGREVRQLHLFKKIDADGIFVAFPREKDFDKVRDDA